MKEVYYKNIYSNLIIYGITHAVIDCICAAVIISIKNQMNWFIDIFRLIILYNFLAFGFQIIFGFLCDYFKTPRLFALLGCFFVGISAIIYFYFPIIAVILAGLGNAIFHVGGGSISLNLTPKKATAPGIYVAPGAMGLFIGTLLGETGRLSSWWIVLFLTILCILMFLIKKIDINYVRKKMIKTEFNYFILILIFVFLSIAIRSLVGMVINYPWKANLNLLIILTFIIVLGKGFGGILADKFGWTKIAIGSLVFSIPFLIFGIKIPLFGILGMFLFNITMPITLVLISNILPGRPGLAFGTTCLALFLGALPTFFPINIIFLDKSVIAIVIIISTFFLYYALKKYFQKLT